MRQSSIIRAFTLVELTAVVLLIGLIASVAMLSLEGVTSGARLRNLETQLSTLYRTAMYEASKQGLPCTIKLSSTQGAILVPKYVNEKWKMSEHWQTKWPRGVRVQGISVAGVSQKGTENKRSWLLSVPPGGAALHWVIHVMGNNEQQTNISIDGHSAKTKLLVDIDDYSKRIN